MNSPLTYRLSLWLCGCAFWESSHRIKGLERKCETHFDRADRFTPSIFGTHLRSGEQKQEDKWDMKIHQNVYGKVDLKGKVNLVQKYLINHAQLFHNMYLPWAFWKTLRCIHFKINKSSNSIFPMCPLLWHSQSWLKQGKEVSRTVKSEEPFQQFSRPCRPGFGWLARATRMWPVVR